MPLKYRKFKAEDRMPVYTVFRESIWDYMLQRGLVDPDDSYELDEYFKQQKGLYCHLEQTAAEDWVAEDAEENIVGWARSIERDNHLQLTHFFVDPNCQGKGIGQELIKRAFTLERGDQRSIIATTNPAALSLYLRQKVSVQGMAFSFYGEPRVREIQSQLQVVKADISPTTLEHIVAIDSQILGYQRAIDLEYFMNHQPTYLFRQQGRLVAYAFGSDGYSTGPAAALEAEHLPMLLQHIEQEASHAGIDSLIMTIPAQARHAVSWAIASGYRMDPFQEVLLARHSSMKLDRFIMTSSAFVW